MKNGVENESRRWALLTLGKIALAAGVGVTTASIEVPLTVAGTTKLEEKTGIHTGNANIQNELETACPNPQTQNECVLDHMLEDGRKFQATVVAPISEELSSRTIPSMLTTESEGGNMIHEAFLGNRRPGFSRREILVGFFTSVLFGALHNVTSGKLNTKIIPLSQTTGGFIYWILQRKLGLVANITSHSRYNSIIYGKSLDELSEEQNK